MSKIIGIIGGGFSGTMTAIQLIHQATEGFSIFIISEKEDLNRGIAYNPYSTKHILNVVTAKMSAFPDKPDDFLDWVMELESYKSMDRTIIANSFLSRKLYGDYLCHLWQKTLPLAEKKGISIIEINDTVVRLTKTAEQIQLEFNHTPSLLVDKCVIASGNQVPKNPVIANINFYTSQNYFQNPWKVDSVEHISNDLPVLILGNGLTMVDTIIGLHEQKFKGKIYSISPNGFNILPHRHGGMKYTAHLEEIVDNLPLHKLVEILHRHIKIVRQFGVSAEPIIDALRPYTQKIWRGLSQSEKEQFMSRLRHLFGVARHRIPLHIHDKIQQLRINNILNIYSGKILDITENDKGILVHYYDKKERKNKELSVSRVINCTGPESNLSKLNDNFLSQCIADGLLVQDELKLGIKTNIQTYRVYNSSGEEVNNLFTLGSNLRGELWETTAVNELRQQAASLAQVILTHKSNGSEIMSGDSQHS